MSIQRLMVVLLVGVLLLSACAKGPATDPPSPAPNDPPAQENPKETPPENPGTNPETPNGKPVEPQETPTEKPVETPPPAPKMEVPVEVRGIQVTGWIAGTGETLEDLLTWAKGAGINTVVVDIKAEDGRLSWDSTVPLAEEIGANISKIADLQERVAKFHEYGFWVIGRVVVFSDPLLYAARSEWAVPGLQGTGYTFMKPMEEKVWEYNLEVAKAAVAAGVNEIQFDYIRFPERLIDGYNRDTTPEFRTGHINSFLKRAVESLHPLGAKVGAAVFGLTTSVVEGDDMQLGQDYRQVAEIVDHIAPMIYPSHYALGTYGLDDPDKAPYETVKRSMEDALKRSPGVPLEKHRPWIQDFTYPAAGYMKYGKAEVEGQIRALAELGIKSYLVWDPESKFTRTVEYGAKQ